MAEEAKTPGSNESYACRVCRATFANSSNRLRHLKKQHPGEYTTSADLHDDQTQSSGFVGLTIRQQVQAAMTSVLVELHSIGQHHHIRHPAECAGAV